MPKNSNSHSIFPKNFLWGASTASHQVEGGTHNQWSVWELAHANEFAKQASKRLGDLQDWERIKPYATNPENYISGRGVEHYKRFREDFDILQKLNLNAFRFGIEWSRLQPSMGAWDAGALQHYHEYIQELKARGIEPVMNLWHWTMPTWFTDLGGFEKTENLDYWEEFVARIADEFTNEVTYIITINEPNVYASFSYYVGEWPPEERSLLTAFRVYRNLAEAHRRAYGILKERNKSFQVGLAAQLANIQAKRPHNYIDSAITQIMRYAWNWWFLNRVRRQQDFVGFNYYFTDYYKGFRRVNPSAPKNDLGWYMEPEGLYPILMRIWRHYKKPIIVTENGVADDRDEYRQWWISETMVAMERAISDGVDIRGYLHWSLLDNFEWKYGWWPKFGLVEVDREHGMKRKIRPSALWWAERLKKIRGL
jgi:beta-glucosidase